MKPAINYEDFDKLELRVGLVAEVGLPEWSNKLVRMRVDFGDELGERIIFSGIRKWYGQDELLGKRFVYVLNMEAKKMGDEQSEGMMIMVDSGEKPILVPVADDLPAGSIVR